MGGLQVAILLLIVLTCAGFGNYLTFTLQQRFGLSTKGMIGVCLMPYLFLAVLMTVGISPLPVGLKNVSEAYLFSVLHGLALGPIQAYSRSFMADLTVKSKEAEWFALYEITDKGSSWIGPLIVGEIYAATNNFNIAFLPLLVMVLISYPLVWCINHEKGMLASGRATAIPASSEIGHMAMT